MTNYQIEPDPQQVSGDIVAGDPGQRGRDRILLGRLIETGPLRNLYLDVTGEQVLAILGKRGTGKSYTLGVLIEGLASGQGKTPIAELKTPRAGLVLDIMDIFWSSKVQLSDDGSPEIVRQFNLMRNKGFETRELSINIWIPAGFENTQIDPPGVRSFCIQPNQLEIDDWASLFNVDIFTEPRGMLIADLVAHVARDGYLTNEGVKVNPKPDYMFSDLLKCIDSDVDIANNYRHETIRSIRQRITTFSSFPLFSDTGTALTELIKPFHVSVLMLARVPDALKKVIVATLLKRILRERRDASFAQKRLDLDSNLADLEAREMRQFIESSIPRTWVCLDEAHVLAGASDRSVAGDALIKYAKEGRNYGLSLAVATQQPSALDSRLMSQAETLIVHQLTSPADASVAQQNMRSPNPERVRLDGVDSGTEILLRRLGQGEIAFSCGNAPHLQRVCVAAVRPRVTAHGGYEA